MVKTRIYVSFLIFCFTLNAQEISHPKLIVAYGTAVSTIHDKATFGIIPRSAFYVDVPVFNRNRNVLSVKTFSTIEFVPRLTYSPYEYSYNLAFSYKKMWKQVNLSGNDHSFSNPDSLLINPNPIVSNPDPPYGIYTGIGFSMENGLKRGSRTGSGGWFGPSIFEANRYNFAPGLLIELGWVYNNVSLIIPVNINFRATIVGMVLGLNI